ncbi:hypothetical protein [Kosakonia cowanii]|uniref:hypothetical protein n=1 Tax=Kosakonia cowanii TaxID=208223 RepID=UPI002FDD7B5A
MTNNDELAMKLKQTAQLVHDNEQISNYGKLEAWKVRFRHTASPVNILALLAERDADKKRIAEFQRQEHYRTRQAVIDGLAASGECWDDIKEYMEKWDAEAERIKLKAEE